MELVNQLANNQLVMYIPVALVLACAILVFAFGFKSAEQPAFDKLSALSDDRKPAGKKRKIKEKVRKNLNENVLNKQIYVQVACLPIDFHMFHLSQLIIDFLAISPAYF